MRVPTTVPSPKMVELGKTPQSPACIVPDFYSPGQAGDTALPMLVIRPLHTTTVEGSLHLLMGFERVYKGSDE